MVVARRQYSTVATINLYFADCICSDLVTTFRTKLVIQLIANGFPQTFLFEMEIVLRVRRRTFDYQTVGNKKPLY